MPTIQFLKLEGLDSFCEKIYTDFMNFTELLAELNEFEPITITRPIGFFVYILFENDTVIYVGSSSNIFKRLGTHVSGSSRESPKPFTRVIALPFSRRNDMLDTEDALIEILRPRLNGLRAKIRRSADTRDRTPCKSCGDLTYSKYSVCSKASCRKRYEVESLRYRKKLYGLTN